MLRTSYTRMMAVAGAALTIGASTYAVNLVSGSVNINGVSSGTVTTLTGGTLLASTSQNFLTSAWGGTLYTTVIRETTGYISFLYQVKVTGGTKTADYIPRMTTIDFTGYNADVDYFTDAFTGFGFVAPVGATAIPYSADRNTSNVIGFNFSKAGDAGIRNGDLSHVMYIRTNGQNYVPGSTNFINGHVASVDSFAPTVPGPAAILPFALGLIASLKRRRK